ncbi:MAG TPA: bifunctional UDP-sugar hydrolase/5'-nucleotidase [Vicinamibacterales bacterium]|nr:bifunctional UDP-sugar hydrolase/5'-nucleotidase [Vicinamibacterales bacterium]
MTRLCNTWTATIALALAGPALLQGLSGAAGGSGDRRHLRAPYVLHAQQEELSSPRRTAAVTILQMNDVYSTVPVDGLGGLARVATVKKQTAQALGRTPLLMLAGDFLSSSVASAVFKGEQMLESLNAIGLDYATFGNHEFDFGVDVLIARMRQSTFEWLAANIVDRQTNELVGGAKPYVIRTMGGLKVGIIGLCITTEGMTRPDLRARLDMRDPIETAEKYVPEMKRAGADVIVALTHLRIQTDRALAERVPDIDVIVGGHEHYPITSVTGRTLISKAGMDARMVARIDLDRKPGQQVDRYVELIPVTSAIREDPAAADVVQKWESRLTSEMNDTVGSTAVPLVATDVPLRLAETNIGNLVADAIRAEAQADVAFINSGAIRGNRVYPAGPLRRRDLIQMHPFNNVVCKIEVSGELLLRALNVGVSKLPVALGGFPQVSGMTFRVLQSAPVGDRVREVRINGVALEMKKTYTLGTISYVIEGGDGYELLMNSRVLIDPEEGTLLPMAVEKFIGGREIRPAVEGRIIVEP